MPDSSLVDTQRQGSYRFVDWVQWDETISIIRPGHIGILSVDEIQHKAGNQAKITEFAIKNSGEIIKGTSIIKRNMAGGLPGVIRGCNGFLKAMQNEEEKLETHLRVHAFLEAMDVRNESRKSWKTFLSVNGGREAGIISNAETLREMFKLREKPEGRTRREALVHIVSSHWRKGVKDTDDRRYVEGYLRGATEFEWFGMQAKIHTHCDL
jgi:hypothetical protein